MAADRDGYARVGEALLETGTTAFQPTFVTAPEDALLDALRAMPLDGIGPRVLGAHVEGPFLSPRRLGVHDVARLLGARPGAAAAAAGRGAGLPGHAGAGAAGRVRADRRARRARRHGVGRPHRRHRGRGPPGLRPRRARRSRTSSTRCATSTPRDPSIALAALARPDVIVQVIVDLHHVAPDTVLVAWQAAPGRFALVTDAAPAAGMGDGEFVLGGRDGARGRRRRARARGPAGGLGADDDRRRAQPARRSASRSRTRCGRPRRCRRGSRSGRTSAGWRRARRPTWWCSTTGSR